MSQNHQSYVKSKNWRSVSVTEESFQPSWFENIDFEYDEFRAERDEALIRFFVQLLWDLEEEEDLLKAVDNEYLD